MKVLSKTLITESEKNAVSSGAFSWVELMGTAGNTAAKLIDKRFECVNKRILILCGNGNNGGDGFVAANYFYEHGANVEIFLPLGLPQTENALYYYNALKGVKILNSISDNYDIVIDAVFGIGLNRDMSEELNSLFDKVNSFNSLRVAIDVPSGVEADSGKALGTVFDADFTVTFIALKPCFLLPPASDFCGETIVADIGVATNNFSYSVISAPSVPKRRHNSHKGTYGTALLICGSYGMVGAAMLSAKACLRSGVGIAKCVLCESVYPAFTSAVPEAVCVPTKQNDCGTFKAEFVDTKNLLEKASAVLFGCGVGKSEDIGKILEKLITSSSVPIILDADGINALACNIDLLKESKAPVIITPHPAEMGRLCQKSVAEVEADRIGTARDFATKHNLTVVLKGANTIIASPDGKISFNILGNTGMAKGGCGDVLSGIMVSLLAQGLPVKQAVEGAVYLHSLAGDKAASKKGERQMLPSDIIDEL